MIFCGLDGLDTTASQSQAFFKELEMLKIDQLCSAENLNFSNTFFQMAAILKEIVILT